MSTPPVEQAWEILERRVKAWVKLVNHFARHPPGVFSTDLYEDAGELINTVLSMQSDASSHVDRMSKALLPLAEALSNVPTAGFLRSDPNPEQVTFVFDYTRYMSEYGQIIGVALDNAPAGSVPMPRLRKLLKPLTVGGVCITQLENIFMARLRGRDQPNINAQWEKIDPAHWAHVFARVITWLRAATEASEQDSKSGNVFIFSVYFSSDYIECIVHALEIVASLNFEKISTQELEDYRIHPLFVMLSYLSAATTMNVEIKDKAAVKYAASTQVQNRVDAVCVALLEATLDPRVGGKMPPPVVQRLLGLVACSASMWGAYNLLEHGMDARCTDPMLRKLVYMGDAWVALMALPTTDNMLASLEMVSAWPGVLATLFTQIKKEDEFASLRNIPYSRGGANPDPELFFEAVERCCCIGATLPQFLQATRGRGFMGLMTGVKEFVASYTADFLTSLSGGIAANPLIAGAKWQSAWPAAVGAMLAGLKAVGAVGTAPQEVWELAREPNFSSEARRDAALFGMVKGYLQVLVFIQSWQNEDPHHKWIREATAVVLVGLHTYKSTPIWAASGVRDRTSGPLLGDLQRCHELLTKVVTSQEVAPLAALENSTADMATVMMEEIMEAVPGLTAADMPPLVPNAVSGMNEARGIVLKVLGNARKASDDDTERAIERAKVLGALPCAYVGCRTLRPAGRRKISGKQGSGCKEVRYCGQECQKKDWKLHKIACKALSGASGK